LLKVCRVFFYDVKSINEIMKTSSHSQIKKDQLHIIHLNSSVDFPLKRLN